MLQLVTPRFQPSVTTTRKELYYPFYKELAASDVFVRLPLNQPAFARNLSGKVISSRRLLAMVNHAIAVMQARDADRTAADNERLMAKSFAPAFHLGRTRLLRQQAHNRDVIAFNLLENALNAEILG